MAKKLFKQREFQEAIKETIFKKMYEEKRQIGLREFGKQIGVSAATLSRAKNGIIPDLEIYFRICLWMKKSTNEFYHHTPEVIMFPPGVDTLRKKREFLQKQNKIKKG